MSGLFTRKELEWEWTHGVWFARSIGGSYIVYGGDDGPTHWKYAPAGGMTGRQRDCASTEEGKQLAQAHHNKALDEWLEPQPDNAGCMLCAIREGRTEFILNEDIKNLRLSDEFVETPAEVLETETPQPPDVDLQPGRTTTTGKYIRSLEETKNVDFPCSPEDGLDLGGGE